MTNPNDPTNPVPYHYKGLTKREYMATKIIAGMVANEKNINTDLQLLSELAIKATDALINALNKES